MTQCYCSLLRTATRKFGSAYDQALAPFGINIAQYSLLKIIESGHPLNLTELGRIAELDRSTIGRNVRVMERVGLVEIRLGEDDHRTATVSLTARGSSVLAKALPAWESCQRKVEKRLGPAKVRALHEALRLF